MTRLFLALIGLLAFGGISQAQKPSSWVVSYEAGGMNGDNFLGGTEIRELLPWNPGKPDAKLYAGNGYWEDVPGPEGYKTAQVLVLNQSAKSGGTWQQDVNFGDFCPKPPTPPRCALATSALAKLLFSKDKNGTPLSPNVQVLVASTWDVRAAKPVPVNVYTKNNSGPCLPETDPSCQGSHDAWWETQLGTAPSDQGAPQVRSFATHVDTVTGENWAFAGEAPTGIFHGQLNDKRGAKQNIIVWTTQTPESANVEFSTKDYQGPPCNGLVRVSSFAEAADATGKIRLFAAICYQIWVRVDGPDCRDPARPEQIGVLDVDGVCRHHWKVFWTDPAPAASSETGLRGLTMVKYQGKDVLLVGGEGGKLRIYRIDPDTGFGEAELDVIDSLANNWNLPLGYTITAYNSMPLWLNEAGVGKRLIGLESFVREGTTPVPLPDRSFAILTGNRRMEGDGWYVMRNAADSYQLVHIPRLVSKPMVAVRAEAQSPFSDECNPQGQNCAIYFGGFDANKSNETTPCFAAPCTIPPLAPVPTHNTGWIMEGLSPQ